MDLPSEGWRHATNPARFYPGGVFGWIERGKLWSGVVQEVDYLGCRVRVTDILPGVIDYAD